MYYVYDNRFGKSEDPGDLKVLTVNIDLTSLLICKHRPIVFYYYIHTWFNNKATLNFVQIFLWAVIPHTNFLITDRNYSLNFELSIHQYKKKKHTLYVYRKVVSYENVDVNKIVKISYHNNNIIIL